MSDDQATHKSHSSRKNSPKSVVAVHGTTSTCQWSSPFHLCLGSEAWWNRKPQFENCKMKQDDDRWWVTVKGLKVHNSDANTHRKGTFMSMATLLLFIYVRPCPLLQGCGAWSTQKEQNKAWRRHVVSTGPNDSECTFLMPKLTVKGQSSALRHYYYLQGGVHALWSSVVGHDRLKKCRTKQDDVVSTGQNDSRCTILMPKRTVMGHSSPLRLY